MITKRKHMKVFLILFLTCLSQIPSTGIAQTGKDTGEIMYAGTMPGHGSKGIYVLGFNRKEQKLVEIQTVDEKRNPNFLAIHPNRKYLYAIYGEGMSLDDKMGTLMSFTIDPATGLLTKLNEQSTEGNGPAHVSVDPKGRFVYVANYGQGNFAIYPILSDGRLGKAQQVLQSDGSGFDTALQKHPFVHSVIPSADGKFIYVSALGLDKIMIYQVKDAGNFLPGNTPFASSKPGSGPRHLIFTSGGQFAFSVEEITTTVASYRRSISTGALTPMERFRMVPDTYTERTSGADIHLSPDDKFLYVSVRGMNVIAIYSVNTKTGKLTFIGREDGHGDHPRNFCMDKKGEYVFVGNMKSDNIAVFKRDTKTGKMTFIREESVPQVACLIQP